MNHQTNDQVRTALREQYASVARSGCGPEAGSCGTTPAASLKLGYSADDLATVPEGANMGLGCGTPQALASDLVATAAYVASAAVTAVEPVGRPSA